MRLLGRALSALLQRLGVGALLRAVGLDSLLAVGGELGLPVAGSLLLLGEGVLLVLLVVDVGLCMVSSVNCNAEIGPRASRQLEGTRLRRLRTGRRLLQAQPRGGRKSKAPGGSDTAHSAHGSGSTERHHVC